MTSEEKPHPEPGVVERQSDDGDASHDPQLDVGENAWIRLMTLLHWYPKAMPSLEKKLVLKLDLMILIFGCLSFFTKYLDQASLTNAYVT